MSSFISNSVCDQLTEKFSGFDFGGAVEDILRWQGELSTDLEDEISFNVLEAVLDIIIDRSEFNG